MRSFLAEVFGHALSELFAKLLNVGALAICLLAVAGFVDMQRLLDRLVGHVERERDLRRPDYVPRSTRAELARRSGERTSMVSSASRGDDPYASDDERPSRKARQLQRSSHEYDTWRRDQARLSEQARRAVTLADRGSACEVKHRLHNLTSRGAARWLDRRSLLQIQPLMPRIEALCPQRDRVPFGALLQLAGSRP
ncbi:MAG TPA: hypothetical protein VMF89_32660 [Polyangiales bacterium]|nr:hypothetical protein [Polyangiales bacterium]